MAKAPLPVSPLAPKGGFPALPRIDGVRFASGAAGVRYKNRTDVMLIEICAGASVAGVFTRSSTRSAPVLDCERKLAALGESSDQGFGIIVNSGNSNAFTGRVGDQTVAVVTAEVGRVLDIPTAHVFSASTGVIGEPFAPEKITHILTELVGKLDADGADGAARAIMTTDTFPKGATETLTLSGHEVKIAGFAKGSGMIAPDMATMLAYVFTDAAISRATLQSMLSQATKLSFNAVTVDSDTSTSDSLMVAATGKAGNPQITDLDSADAKAFYAALEAVLKDLALQLVRDGEGATKLIEVQVTGAVNDADADRVARAIANSPLVKTAAAGEDPNWGRVVMAVGKSGAVADRDRLTIKFGDILVAENGWVSPDYREEQGAAYMKQQELRIAVNMGLGMGAATVWACDLTHGYISINADYRS
ncbi:bifunctional glutamate N-acetyltransferase/amino-acid acetyltransferase ArgJ [Rhodobacterales bacterium LSUCC0387]|nr:bifunctional glutamate N-acetyltransferase/amino-acid acetyltransferase ArgJ [Rhodobacterales bacterium LSUCC0387]